MISFVRKPKARARRVASHFALALALASGAAVAGVALEAPAHAAKKDKKEEGGKADYSKSFVEAYKPIAASLDANEDATALKAQVPALVAALETNDDKFAAGQAIYMIGTRTKDIALQRQGLDLMLDSGKVSAEARPNNLFAAGQLAVQAEDYAAARTRFQQALDAGYTENDPLVQIAETYFTEENVPAGLDVLNKAIEARVAAGKEIPENWITRGLAVAYNNDMADRSLDFARVLVRYYPTTDHWGDAIAILRNSSDLDNAALLDILRLGRMTGSLRYAQDYNDYINVADARRVPSEVSDVIAKGIAAGKISASDVLVKEAADTAKSNVASVRADLGALEKDGLASGDSKIAMNAGEVFLGFGEGAKAEAMFKAALGKTGVDTNVALTRMGIAQVMQGKTEEAKATLAKVQGARKPIAALWSVYAESKAGGAQTAAQPAAQPTT